MDRQKMMMNALRYGLLFASAIFLWALLETVLGLHDRYIRYHEYLSYFFAVPSVGIMYVGICAGEETPAKGMRFRRALWKGLAITAVVAVLSPVVWLVFCTFVNPAFLGNMAQYAIESNAMTPSLAAKRYALPNYLFVSAFSMAIIGAVISLVIAIIMAGRQRKQ
ncbi:DUF4199 domain-containing protein [Parapedobacter sp.]